MTPQDFIDKWGAPSGVPGPAYALNEEQGAQSHFLDLCELLGVPKPGSRDDYRLEEKSAVIGGKTGYADVFKRGVFAWENKAPGKNLDAALKQLLTYSLALSNPPILVVSDRLTIRIHTQFTGHPSQTHTVLLDELDQPDKLALLRRIWTAPESFKPKETNRDITEVAAKSFATLADLFGAMADGGMFGADNIPWFNGGLFKRIDVPELSILDVTELRNAANLNWSDIDVSIFGTLFESGLNPAKRSHLGAHYTATIDRIIDPVLRRPLLQKWKLVAKDIQGLQTKSIKKGDKNYREAKARFIGWLDELAHQRTETLPSGAVIPADIYKENKPLAQINKGQEATKTILTSANESIQPTGAEAGVARMSGAISKSEAYEPPASEPSPPVPRQEAIPAPVSEPTQPGKHHAVSTNGMEDPQGHDLRQQASAIVQAAKKLNDLKENWLNPPEWAHRVPEVTPPGMNHSPYPDRIEPRPGISDADLKALQKRTLTNLYNARPAWLTMAHQQLDAAVAAAYGWADYTAVMPDDEILKRLLALNLARSVTISGKSDFETP